VRVCWILAGELSKPSASGTFTETARLRALRHYG
jgi:hypothetical protein